MGLKNKERGTEVLCSSGCLWSFQVGSELFENGEWIVGNKYFHSISGKEVCSPVVHDNWSFSIQSYQPCYMLNFIPESGTGIKLSTNFQYHFEFT